MQDNKKAVKSILGPVVLITAFVFGGLFLLASSMTENVTNKKYDNLKTSFVNQLSSLLKEKFAIGKTVAISLGHNRDIKEALKSDDRELAIESLSGLSASYADNTNLKNVKIHIHTKDVKSFLRNWNLDKYGDRLDTFRYTINRVKNSKRPLVAIEVGKAGLSIRGISPVIDNGEYLGSVEFMQGFNSVVKDMRSNDISLLVLMGDTHSKLLFKQKDKLKNLTISQKEYDKDFKEALSSINFQRLREENYLIVKNYFVACVPIMDYEDNQVGVYIMGQDLKHINTEISGAKDLIDTSIMLIISALITFGLVFYVARKK